MTQRRSFVPGVLTRQGLALALATVSQTAAVPAQSSYEVSLSPDVVVLQLSEEVGIRDADRTPLVRLYGDGRVVVHFPAYMRRAGDYELWLPEEDVQRLVGMAVDGLPFDAAAPESEVLAIETAERNDGLIVDVSDAATTILEVRFERGRTGGVTEDVRDGFTRVAWTGLVSDALVSDVPGFGDVVALRNLAAVQSELLALVDHPDLTRRRTDR
jgi:hypothetical protein